ncbi:MAG: hypothetical protein FWG47_07685 [Propionibacteriaceae bacterium]|nr:hypothetical protein [Propionibacteriaceae bacterium]
MLKRILTFMSVAALALGISGCALNIFSGGNDLIEFEAVFSDVTEHSHSLQFKLDETLYSVYIISGEIQTQATRGLKEIGFATDDFGKYRIFERDGFPSNEFIVVKDYGFMNPAVIYKSDA